MTKRVADKFEARNFGQVSDGKDFFQNGLEAGIFAFVGRGVSLEKISIRRLLIFKQVWQIYNLSNFVK
jgi:hypothetical protein